MVGEDEDSCHRYIAWLAESVTLDPRASMIHHWRVHSETCAREGKKQMAGDVHMLYLGRGHPRQHTCMMTYVNVKIGHNYIDTYYKDQLLYQYTHDS